METVFKKCLLRVNDVAVLTNTDKEVDLFTGFLVGVPDKI